MCELYMTAAATKLGSKTGTECRTGNPEKTRKKQIIRCPTRLRSHLLQEPGRLWIWGWQSGGAAWLPQGLYQKSEVVSQFDYYFKVVSQFVLIENFHLLFDGFFFFFFCGGRVVRRRGDRYDLPKACKALWPVISQGNLKCSLSPGTR